MKIKPTAEECKIIRAAAARESKYERIRLDLGLRFNLDDGRKSVNQYLITDSADNEDTDLADFVSWVDFKSGFEATEDGRALLDFYVYSVGPNGSLECNVQALYLDGKLHRVKTDGKTAVLWADDREGAAA